MKKLLFPLILLVVILAPLSVFAADVNSSLLYLDCYNKDGGCGVCDVVALTNTIVRVILQLAGVVSLVMFVWAGLDFVTSAGSAEKIKSGRQKLIGSVTGILIIYSAWVGVNFLVKEFTGGNNSVFSFGQWNRLECISEPETYMQTVEQNQATSAASLYGPGGSSESTVTINGHNYSGSSLPTDTARYATIADGTYNYEVVDHYRYGKSLMLERGGRIPTVGLNPNAGSENYGKPYATEIFVHKQGIRSEGCITVSSNQWNDFISNFRVGQRGTITVFRSGQTGMVTITIAQ